MHRNRPLAKMLLCFDASAFVEAISFQVVERLGRDGHQGIVLGASGGLDSMVAAALCCRGAARSGKHGVVAVCMTDARLCGERYNTELYRELGAELFRIDITHEAASAEARMNLPPRHRIRFILNAFKIMPRRLRKIITLAAVSRSLPRWASKYQEALLLHHRIRIKKLREIANSFRYLTVVCANRTESDLGYYVEGGIDDPSTGDWSPILGLYKTQVALTARYLKISPLVLRQQPSPGFGVIVDEDILGPYALVDQALVGIARGYSDEAVAELMDPAVQAVLPWNRGAPRLGNRRSFVRFIRRMTNAARRAKLGK